MGGTRRDAWDLGGRGGVSGHAHKFQQREINTWGDTQHIHSITTLQGTAGHGILFEQSLKPKTRYPSNCYH